MSRHARKSSQIHPCPLLSVIQISLMLPTSGRSSGVATTPLINREASSPLSPLGPSLPLGPGIPYSD